MTITTTIDATAMRDWLGLKTTDSPVDATINKHINWSLVPMEAEIDTSDTNQIDYLVLLKAGSQLMKWLARRSVKNGYIEFNGTGISIKKSPGELLELAQDLEKDYNDFCAVITSEVTITTFLGGLTDRTAKDLTDMWQGVSNAFDYQSTYHPSLGRQNS